MERNIQKALEEVDMLYSQISEIADEIIKKCVGDIDILIQEARNNSHNLTNDDLRKLSMDLSFRAVSFGDIKERACSKTNCAEALKKETYAKKFIEIDGTVAQREYQAQLKTSEAIVVELLQDLISTRLKTKLDEIHRVVDTIKTALMTRVQERKLNSNEGVII